MVFGNGFFTYTENEALEEMTRLAGCRVLQCVYPTASKISYYLSEKGDCFSVQNVQGKYLVRTKTTKAEGHNKRRGGGLIMRVKSTPSTERQYNLEWMMYCTFILGRWEEQKQLLFLDGNPKNVRPDNLLLPKEVVPVEWAAHMEDHKYLYRDEFYTVVKIVTGWTGLPMEDVKDVVQSVFIYFTTIHYDAGFNGRLWCYWSKKRALDYLTQRYLRFAHGEFLEDTFEGGTDTHCEIDLYGIQPNQKSRRGRKGNKAGYELYLWAHGHTPTEIAEMVGSTIGTVGCNITRRLQYLKNYLKHEEKLLR